MKQTYRGSCHCGLVQFEADIDLASGTGKCNCSFCWKTRAWGVTCQPRDFRLLSGERELAGYQFATKSGHHRFCRHCGVRTHGHGNVEALGGAIVSINLAALDDLDPTDLVAAPLTFMDGRHDNWWNVPAETRHL